MMDSQTIKTTAISAAITLMITMLVGWGVGVFNKGVEASDKELIRKVVLEEITTDEGVTTKAAIATILRNLEAIDARVDGISENVSEIRSALLILAGDG